MLVGTETKDATLIGSLEPAAPNTRDTNSTPKRALLQTLEQALADAEDAQDASTWSWVPLLTLMGGVHRASSTPDPLYGYLLGLALQIPLWSRGQNANAIAAAADLRARAAVTTWNRDIDRRRARAQLALAQSQSELRRFRKGTAALTVTMSQASARRYEEGHGSLLELIDAEQTRQAVRRRETELLLRAKRAELQLQAAEGAYER